jgi:hypothetical protein
LAESVILAWLVLTAVSYLRPRIEMREQRDGA